MRSQSVPIVHISRKKPDGEQFAQGRSRPLLSIGTMELLFEGKIGSHGTVNLGMELNSVLE